MRLATFDPRSPTSTVLLWLAIAACLTMWVPTLIQVYEQPELRPSDPVRALLQDSLIERASKADPGGRPPLADTACQLCTRHGTERAWAELGDVLDQYVWPEPVFARDPEGRLERARLLSLERWGDPSYVGSIAEQARGEGVRVVSAKRLHLIGWVLFGLQVVVVLLSLPLWWWLRRRARIEREAPFSPAEGVRLWTWLMGASAILYAVAADFSLGEVLVAASPLPDLLLLAGILGIACHPSWAKQLARSFGLWGGDWRQLAGYAVVLLAMMLVSSLGSSLLAEALGCVPPWAHGSSDSLVYGATAEKWWRVLHLVVTGPVFEELAFTALLFGSLVGRFGFARTALSTSLVFAGVHAYDGLGSLDILLGGVASCWCYWRSGSLWPCIFAHGASNAFFASVVLY